MIAAATAAKKKANGKLVRENFRTSRLLEFLSEKELVAQIGHPRRDWPLVLIKELVDNALDACEEAGVAPSVQITVDEHGLTVVDNGPGIPPDVVEDVHDFSVKVSSREAYVSPCRGAQGNALKTVVAMPYVENDGQGRVTIRARGVRHEITLAVDHVRQAPAITHERHPEADFVKTGTSVSVELASSFFCGKTPVLQNGDPLDIECARGEAADLKQRVLQLASDFTFVNPHLSLRFDWYGVTEINCPASAAEWRKWTPSNPTSPHWYSRQSLRRLVAAHLTRGRCATVREFVSEFRGLSSTVKQGRVADAVGLRKAPLTALLSDDERNFDSTAISGLLEAMKKESQPVKPTALGAIGKETIEANFKALGCNMESFHYRKKSGETNGIPWVIEAAFAWCKDATGRRLITGTNWSPGILNPFRELGKHGESLDSLLEQQRATLDEPVVLMLHLACPLVQFADRGKSSVVVGDNLDAKEIIEAVRKVTSKWAKHVKSEERNINARANRERVLTRSCQVNITDAAVAVLEDAYDAVSDNNRLPAHARQLMYEVRKAIQIFTDAHMDDGYFTQTILKKFLKDNPERTADWDVIFDPRGHFHEPHTGRKVALGTLGVRRYLASKSPTHKTGYQVPPLYPTMGPDNRFAAVMFIEKEGFAPLLDQVKLAERYDLAIMSSKGMSNIASRRLVDSLCGENDIPLLVFRDFDKAGFSIAGTLTRSSDNYEFKNKIRVIDLGLRLKDAQKWNLESESWEFKFKRSAMAKNLRKNGATEEEIEFLTVRKKRIELNAFRSADLVRFLEEKLEEHGIRKAVPDDSTLGDAYKSALQHEYIKKHFGELQARAAAEALNSNIPSQLRCDVEAILKRSPELSWDMAVAEVVSGRPATGGSSGDA